MYIEQGLVAEPRGLDGIGDWLAEGSADHSSRRAQYVVFRRSTTAPVHAGQEIEANPDTRSRVLQIDW